MTGDQWGSLHFPGPRSLQVDEVILISGLEKTLLSVSQLAKAGFKCDFSETDCMVYGPPVLQARVANGVYEHQLSTRAPPNPDHGAIAAAVSSSGLITPNSLEDWHRRLGHLHYQGIVDLERSGLVKGLKIVGSRRVPDHPREACALGKITSRPAPQRSLRSQEEKDQICHADLAGKYQRSIHGHHYMFVLKWLGYTHVYFIKTKDETLSCFRKFLAVMKNRNDPRRIRLLRTDNGGEFIDTDFEAECAVGGIERHYSEPDVHYQNGVAERTNRSIIEPARTMLIHSGLPHNLWEYAVRAAVHMRNRVVSRSDATTTPYAKYHGKQPDLTDSHTFGEKVTVLLPPAKRSTLFKFRPVGQRGVFVGHDDQRKGYFVYVREGGARIVHSCDVKFLGTPVRLPALLHPGLPLIPLPGMDVAPPRPAPMRGRPADSTSALPDDANTGVDPLPTTPDHASMRGRNADSVPAELVEAINGSTELTRRRRSERISSRNIGDAFLVMGEVILEPLTLEEARRSPQWSEWEKAILAEIEALRANGTFTVVTPPAGAHVIGTTMNFRVKRHADGLVDRLRARICAQGFQEIYMIDFVDTYAPVARLISIRVFLAECNQSGLRIRQGDVPTAFVKANLREVIYVKQPKGFEEGEPGQVWLLHKALYGLKQAGREWYIELDKFLSSQGLVPTREDPCVYKHPVKLLVVLVYVDDILIGYKHDEDMRGLMDALGVKYGIKDLGELSWFLGMRVTRDFERGVMKIDQEQYAIEVCERFAMDNCRPGETPMDQGVILYPGAGNEELATRVPYKQAVGALLYLSRVTRPDIAFAVNQVAAHAARPTVTHWHAVKKILRYVWGTRSMALVYRRDVHAPRIKVYTDADWANNILDRKSISGILAQVYGCTVHWSCKRQTVVAKSSTAAEFISCSMGVEEVIWIRMFLNTISGVQDSSKIPVLIDNKSTIHRISNGKTSETQKTIDVMFHAIKDTYNEGYIRLEYCPTTTMLADGLTKALGVRRFLDHRTQIGLTFKDSTAELRGSVVATAGGTQINSESSAE